MGKRFVTGPMYCLNKGIPTEVFFCDEDHLGEVAYAKAICNRCVSRDECLEVALENWEPFGIWGGLTAKERSTIQFQEALLQHASPPKIRHEPSHRSNAYSFFPLRTSFEDIRTPQVSRFDFARQMACRVNGIEVSTLLSPESSSYQNGQKHLFETLLDQLKRTQLSLDQNPKYDPKVRVLSNLVIRRSQQPSKPLFHLELQMPNQSIPQDQFLEVAS